jgi:hypothetical protein
MFWSLLPVIRRQSQLYMYDKHMLLKIERNVNSMMVEISFKQHMFIVHVKCFFCGADFVF